MSTLFDKRTLLAGTAALALVAGLLVTGSGLQAQDDAASAVAVGTYDPQQVAQASGFEQKMMQEMQGLQERAQTAQQEGDQATLQQVQQEAQQIQQDATSRLIADIEAVMPQVAASEGVQVIATEVTYTAEGVSTTDVTQSVIDAMGAGTAE